MGVRINTMKKSTKQTLRNCLKLARVLELAMETTRRHEAPDDVWDYVGYKEYARKYMCIVNETAEQVALPPILSVYDVQGMPGFGDMLFPQQREVFESIRTNLSLLRAFLEEQVS